MGAIFGTIKGLFELMFCFLPPAVAVLIVVAFGFIAVLIVCKIIAFILDMIPFA